MNDGLEKNNQSKLTLYPGVMFKNFIFVSLRNLWKNKPYSIIHVLGLSLGLTCAMLIILYTKDEVSYDRFPENNPNFYRIEKGMSDEERGVNIPRICCLGLHPSNLVPLASNLKLC